MTKTTERLNRLFDNISTKLPWTAGTLTWLRNPKNVWVRVPVALLLILGGIFSILPGLGVWMLPLGLLLLAIDVVFLQEPITKFIVIGQRKFGQFVAWVKATIAKIRAWQGDDQATLKKLHDEENKND